MKWNAEFIVDDYNSSEIILRPSRDIQEGKPIFEWYGLQYWRDPINPVNLMAKLVIKYGVNIVHLQKPQGHSDKGASRLMPHFTN